ncbi:hypothetical protein ACAW74_24850 [Fibrella sp. WM1]|uniref:hypothetical protein n=1 Tax=Fibrella musci TaxID=3242485 RepID=UPI00352128B4
MSAPNDFKYRVIYEQLSRFSGNLSRTTSFDEIRQCLQRHVKHLFGYQLIRFCFYQQDAYIVFSLTPTNVVWQQGDCSLLYSHERLLKGNSIPVVINDAALLAQSVELVPFPPTDELVQLWSWNLTFAPDSGVIACVFSTESQAFQAADVTVLKITLENLYAKLQSIRLIDELNASKKAVDNALLALQEKSNVISKLVATQEEVIQQRTRALELKNTKLLHLSRQHAHTIREPLTRILSLTYLIGVLPPEEVINDIIPALVVTSTDLDQSLQQVVQQIDGALFSSDEWNQKL